MYSWVDGPYTLLARLGGGEERTRHVHSVRRRHIPSGEWCDGMRGVPCRPLLPGTRKCGAAVSPGHLLQYHEPHARRELHRVPRRLIVRKRLDCADTMRARELH